MDDMHRRIREILHRIHPEGDKEYSHVLGDEFAQLSAELTAYIISNLDYEEIITYYACLIPLMRLSNKNAAVGICERIKHVLLVETPFEDLQS